MFTCYVSGVLLLTAGSGVPGQAEPGGAVPALLLGGGQRVRAAATHPPAPPQVQYSTVQYSTVQYSTVQCSTVQYSTPQVAPPRQLRAQGEEPLLRVGAGRHMNTTQD